MRNVCVLETFGGSELDNKLFQWAKRVESLGYEVSQIWEAEYPDEVDAVKGINFRAINEHSENMYLCATDTSIYIETEKDFFTSDGYIKFLEQLM